MEQIARKWFSAKQKAELWERWRQGQCVADIGRALQLAAIRQVDTRPVRRAY
jgi:hypothetical protein